MSRLFWFAMLLSSYFTMVDVAISKEECVFDESYYSEKTYKNNNLIRSVVWNDEYKQAKLLTTNGSLIDVQHWACNHIGLQAVMILNDMERQSNQTINSKIQGMLKLLVKPADYNKVSKLVNKMACLNKKVCKKDISIGPYSEFYIQTEHQKHSMTVLLKYYMN